MRTIFKFNTVYGCCMQMRDEVQAVLAGRGRSGFEALCAAATDAIEIAHHIRGRIRLRLVDDGGALPEEAAGLVRAVQSVLERAPGVRSIRVNRLARCCAVEYDAGVLPPGAWGDFFAGADTAEARVLRDVLRAAYVEIADHAQL